MTVVEVPGPKPADVVATEPAVLDVLKEAGLTMPEALVEDGAAPPGVVVKASPAALVVGWPGLPADVDDTGGWTTTELEDETGGRTPVKLAEPEPADVVPAVVAPRDVVLVPPAAPLLP